MTRHLLGPAISYRRKSALAALGLFAATATAAGLAATQGHADAGAKRLVLTVVDDPSAARSVDIPPSGPSAGDMFVYSATIRHGRHVVGRLEGTSAAADPKYHGDVTTQYWVLRDGTIAVVGGGQSGAPGVGRPDNRIYDAIVGGTGRYNGARGWVSGRDINQTTIQRTFHFTR